MRRSTSRKQKLLEIGQTDDFIPAFVIAHEWAHHVQDSVGLERVGPGDRPDSWDEVYSIELELMADCMSGAWAQDLDSRGALETGDIDATVDFTVNTLGDPGFIAEYDPQAHGSGAQRSQSILLGLLRRLPGLQHRDLTRVIRVSG